jgi:hypothetical protein
MKTNKVVNEEGFKAKFFKQGLHAMDKHLADRFNHAICMGFPQSWSHHIIHSIHKLGSSTYPNNYRTIIVGHTFSKLYATTFHLKLFGELERRQLRARGQVGFQLEHQTIDHILIILAIIEEERYHSFESLLLLCRLLKNF